MDKGQSTIEYLTTYGWMILIIAVIGGTVFIFTQDKTSITHKPNLDTQNIEIEKIGIDQQSLKLKTQSRHSDPLHIRKIRIKDLETGYVSKIDSKNKLHFGQSVTNTIEDVEPSKNEKTYLIKITYDAGNLEDLQTTGELTAPIKLTNRINIEKTRFNRSADTLRLQIKNTGQNQTTQVNYTLEGSTTFTGTHTQTLNPGQTTWINISLNQTYPIQNTVLTPEGINFEKTKEKLKCTPTKDLVGYWTFNNEQTIESENQTKDLSGMKNNGTLKNGVLTGIEGKVAESYGFDGDNDYITINSGQIKHQKGSFSFVAWSKVKNHSDNWATIIDDFAHSKKYAYQLNVQNGQLHLDLGDGSHNYDIETSDLDLQDNEWHQVGFKVDRTANKTYLYVDGQESKSKLTPLNESINLDNSLAVGGQSTSESLEGRIDEIRIYNRTLSQNEFERLYNIRNKKWAVNGCKISS